MKAEELLKMLRDAQLDDEAIKALLSDAMASLEGPAEEEPKVDEEAERKEAAKYLGVNL